MKRRRGRKGRKGRKGRTGKGKRGRGEEEEEGGDKRERKRSKLKLVHMEIISSIMQSSTGSSALTGSMSSYCFSAWTSCSLQT